MKIIGVIPARYKSTRLEFKLLKMMGGKPLIQWTWENASKARGLDKLIIACDDAKIAEAAKQFGADVVMTSVKHASGTDRIAEAVSEQDVDVVINIQADEPMMHSAVIDALAREMKSTPGLVMATVRIKLGSEEEVNNPNVVKIICDKNMYAIYFSRHAIPYYRDADTSRQFYKHLGIYAYTKDFLYMYKNLPFSYLEQAEKLEQLRVLEAGYKIKVIDTKFDSVGVDTEEDFRKVEQILGKGAGG